MSKKNVGIFSRWGSKTNRVSRRHRGKFLGGAVKGMFFSKIGGKNDKRGSAAMIGF